MAFCSYFKIQSVAGGADRIKKSEWKLVSHDNSQPTRERQLLVLLLLSPDFASLPFSAPSLSLCFLYSCTESVFHLFSWLAAPTVPLPVLFLLRSSFPFPIPSRSMLNDSLNLSPVQPLHLRYHHRHQPSLSPSSTALNIRQLYARACVCTYMQRTGKM